MAAMMDPINAYSISDAPDSSAKNLKITCDSNSVLRMLISMLNAVRFIFIVFNTLLLTRIYRCKKGAA